jgi:DnaK suppressor protein
LKEVEVTAAKKAAAPAPKRAAVAKRPSPPSRSAASAVKKATATKKSVPAAKAGTAGTKKSVPAKKATPAKKSVPVTKATATKKSVPAKKAAPAAKAAPVTKAPAAAKKAAPAAKAAPPRKPTVGPYAKEPKFLEEQRALLLEERGIYDGQAHDLRAEADSLALEREPGDVQFDEESGEGGTVTVDRERNLALSAQASAAVEEIDDAIRKIDRKTYGACERCHQPIPKARLRALPFARLCVACKSGGLSRR